MQELLLEDAICADERRRSQENRGEKNLEQLLTNVLNHDLTKELQGHLETRCSLVMIKYILALRFHARFGVFFQRDRPSCLSKHLRTIHGQQRNLQ